MTSRPASSRVPWVARSISKGARLVERKNRGRLNGPFAGAVYLPPPCKCSRERSQKMRAFLRFFHAPCDGNSKGVGCDVGDDSRGRVMRGETDPKLEK